MPPRVRYASSTPGVRGKFARPALGTEARMYSTPLGLFAAMVWPSLNALRQIGSSCRMVSFNA